MDVTQLVAFQVYRELSVRRVFFSLAAKELEEEVMVVGRRPEYWSLSRSVVLTI